MKSGAGVGPAGLHEGLVIGVGVAAARLDIGADRETKVRRDLFDDCSAGARFRVVIDDNDGADLPA